MDGPEPKSRWYRLTPDRLIVGLLIAECLLWLSNWLGWPVWYKGYAVLTCMAAFGVAMAALTLWFTAALLIGRRFQYSLRSLLVLVVVVAVPCNWITVEMKNAREHSKAVKAIGYGYFLRPQRQSFVPAWLRRTLGDDLFDTFDGISVREGAIEDAEWKYFSALPELRVLHLSGCFPHNSDAAMEHIKGLHQLEDLDLNCQEKITDTGLKNLKGLTSLQKLNITRTAITDSGLAYLHELRQLKSLKLIGTQITDAGLENLAGLDRLEELCLHGTHVTEPGVQKLQRALPSCNIKP